MIENPTSSTAWKQPELRRLVNSSQGVTVHMCTMGLTDPYTGEKLRKTTRLVTNSPEVIKEFQGQTCAKVCGPLGTREVHKPILGHTWVNRDNTWERVKLSAYADGYTQEFSMKLLNAVSRDSATGTFVENGTRKEQFLQRRAELEETEIPWFRRPHAEEPPPQKGRTGRHNVRNEDVGRVLVLP